MEEIRTPGKTTIAATVLIDIAEMTTLNVSGVSKMANLPTQFNIGKKLNQRNGIQVNIEDDTVNFEVYIEIIPDANIRKIAKKIQTDIGKMMEKMVGMKCETINIHIENVNYEVTE